jgi:hypothetical protein
MVRGTWPARSPDLTIFNFYGKSTGPVYRDVLITPKNMRKRIIDERSAMNPQKLAEPFVNPFVVSKCQVTALRRYLKYFTSVAYRCVLL